MWIRRRQLEFIEHEYRQARRDMDVQAGQLQAEQLRLHVENTRLRSDLDWFKLRLSQVEKERAQLIQSAVGVKIPVPEFIPDESPQDALTEMHAVFKGVGEDIPESEDAVDQPEDFSAMPGMN